MNDKTYENLTKNLRKLQVNREKVGIIVLNAKYRTSYDSLKAEVARTAEEIAREILFGDLPIRRVDEGTEAFKLFISESKRILEEESRDMQEYTRFINRYNAEEAVFRLNLSILKERIKYEAFGLTYWLAHCYEGVNGAYYNDIVDMRHAGGCIWVNDHRSECRMLPPPTHDLGRKRVGLIPKRRT